MKTKDFYKILEIDETATDSDIKSAYRKLARKFHPDIAGSTPENVAHFKDINEAYSTLIDRRKRYNYDALRRLYSYTSNTDKTDTKDTASENAAASKKNNEPKSQYQSKNYFHGVWEDFLNAQHQQKEYKKQQAAQPEDGSDITTEVSITIEEALYGTTKKINVLHTNPCPKCNGRKFTNNTLCQHCSGTGFVSEHKKFTVKIPPNVKNGFKIRIAEEGNSGINGGKNGNLYLLIKIENNSGFKYDGCNILKTVPITPYEAVLGADIEIPVFNGKITMKILPNTNSGQKFRLQGQGLTINGTVGDLIVTVEIKIPDNLSREEIELYKKLAKISTNNLRKRI